MILVMTYFGRYFADCGALIVNNGNFNALSGTTYGQTGTLSCNTGYTLSGESTATCTESGNWTAAAVVCTIVGKFILFYHNM
jgi:hypothetical protein